jgi:nucleoside-diphosphate-sugar epimerase
MKVAITGPNGWIAKALYKKLQDKSLDCAEIQRSWLPQPSITTSTGLSNCLEGTQSIVHLAALVHQMNTAPTLAEYREVNCDITLRLAQCAANAGVKQFIFISTAKVMGEQSSRPYLESDLPKPVDAYAISKFEAETGLRKLQTDGKLGAMKVCVVRPPLVYGQGVRANYEKLLAIAESRWPLPLGDATALRSMVSIERLTDGLVALLTSNEPMQNFEVFFAADPIDRSTADIIYEIRILSGSPARLIKIPATIMRVGLVALGKRSVYDRLFTSLQVDGSRLNALITNSIK